MAAALSSVYKLPVEDELASIVPQAGNSISCNLGLFRSLAVRPFGCSPTLVVEPPRDKSPPTRSIFSDRVRFPTVLDDLNLLVILLWFVAYVLFACGAWKAYWVFVI